VDQFSGGGSLYELEIAIDMDRFESVTSIDNRGTRAVGRYQALLSGGLNALYSTGDRTGVTLFTIPATPKELAYVEITQEQQFGTEGLKGWFTASHSEVDAGSVYSTSDLGSRSTRGLLGLSYPLLRSRDHNLRLFGKFDAVNQRQDVNDVRNFDDRLRVLRFGVDYGLNDSLNGQNALGIEISRGLDVLGASDGNYAGQSRAKSRTDGHAVFTKLTLNATRRQKLGDKWAVQLSVAGQKSDERLLSNEEFYIGGAQFGRAYDSGEISGDDGAAASAEIQYGEFLSLPYLDSYQFYGFYDFGIVWETEATDFNGRTTLSSTGGEPRNSRNGGLAGRRFAWDGEPGITAGGEPASRVLGVAPVSLEAATPVRALEQIDALRAVRCFERVQNRVFVCHFVSVTNRPSRI
jgi:hemolysin activation/secretion protein